MSCDEIRQNLVLLIYGDLEALEKEPIEAHVASCGACRVALAEERRLHAMLSERGTLEPSDDLLAGCRRELAVALQGEPQPAGREAGRRAWWSWRMPSPAFATALLAIGFLSGWLAMEGGLLPEPRPEMRAGPGVTGGDVTTDLKSVQFDPAERRVRLTYDTRTRAFLEGEVDDPGIRRVLLDTVRGGANAGMRLDAIELLEDQVADAEVRHALMEALRHDGNAGARLKALAALDDRAASDPDVRDAMTQALLRDDNLGVRVQAIDALARAADPQLEPLMRRLARDDAEPYIRLRSGAIADAMHARVKR